MNATSPDRRFSAPGGLSSLLLAALFLGMAASPAQAGLFQFSDWVTDPSSQATVAWNYSAGTATLTGSVPVNFRFDNLPELSTNIRPATLTITASTNIAGTLAGSIISEPLSGSISISDGTNLLTIGFVGAISGVNSGGSATLSGDVTLPGDTVTFSSDYISFVNPSNNSFFLALPTITAPPGLTLNGSNFISDFTSNVQGSASTGSPNDINPVPEPASLVSVCTGLAATGFLVMVRRRRKPG